MKDDFTTHADPMLVESAPLHNIRLEAVVDHGHKLESESLQSDELVRCVVLKVQNAELLIPEVAIL